MAARRDQLNLRPEDLQHVWRRERAEPREDLIEEVSRKNAGQRDNDQQRGKNGQEVVIRQLGRQAEAVVSDSFFQRSFEQPSPSDRSAKRDRHLAPLSRSLS